MPTRQKGEVEWKKESGGTRQRTGGEVKGKEANGVGSLQSSAWLGRVTPVLLQSFSADPHSKKASTWLNWHPRRYKWTRPVRWKTESGFCACAITIHFHSTRIALPILVHNIKRGWGGQCHVPATSPLGKRPGTCYTGCALVPVWWGLENLASTAVWIPHCPAHSK